LASEEVGPGHPPREHMFRPGQSGNPRGRPPRSRNLATLLFRQLNEKILVDGRRITRFEAMLRAQVDRAVDGEPRAVRQVIEYWLSYFSNLPDGVDDNVEFGVVVKTAGLLQKLYRVQRAEKAKRAEKAAKRAERKKARAERARKKRIEAKAARMAAAKARLAAGKAESTTAADKASSSTVGVRGSPPTGSR